MSGLLWLVACAPDSATALRDALASGDCGALASEELRDQCWVSRVECAGVSAPRARAECAFREAEATKNPARCADAGPWVDDCRLHLWSASFKAWAPRGVRPGEAEELATTEVAKYGFSEDDPRPWAAWYRWVLAQTRPLDRQACHRIGDPDRREACLQTGLAYYDDLLNMARDRKLYPCDGGPLPEVLTTTPDPEIDALRAARTDLCPG